MHISHKLLTLKCWIKVGSCQTLPPNDHPAARIYWWWPWGVFLSPSPLPTSFTMGSGKHSLSPSDSDQASAGLPHLMNKPWDHDISERDGEPALPHWDSPWLVSRVCCGQPLSISRIRLSQDLGRMRTKLSLKKEQSAKGSKLRRKDEIHGFNFRLPGTGVLVNTCLGSCYPQWRYMG